MPLFSPIGQYYQRAREFHSRYERFLMPAMLVLGFLVDYFTFANVRVGISFGLLIFYWALAGLAMLFISLHDAGRIPERFNYARVTAFLLTQFTFGNLLSGCLVFYWFSGALSVSWPLMAVLAFLMLFNDVFRSYFSRTQVQLAVYFFITLSLLAVILPFWFNSMSAWLFVAAGALSLAIFYGYCRLLFFTRSFSRQQKISIGAGAVAITLAMNALYFLDAIPPIPLALREAGAYHNLVRNGGSYVLSGEPETFWQNLVPGQSLRLAPGETTYLYTAIFAPLHLDTAITHHWQYYNQEKGDWITVDKLSFEIFGGRKEGYKGYSYLSGLAEGNWRVFVENSRGQVLGRVNFSVKHVPEPVSLVEAVR